MFQRLTPDEIKIAFQRNDVKSYIRWLVNRMKEQGVTQLFINPDTLVDFAKALKRELLVCDEINMDEITAEAVEEAMIDFISEKIAKELSEQANVTNENIAALVDVATQNMCGSRNAFVLFGWMQRFVGPYKQKYATLVFKVQQQLSSVADDWNIKGGMEAYFKLCDSAEKRNAYFEETFNEALPCGMRFDVDELRRKYRIDVDFKRFDVNPLISMVYRDVYYPIVFKDVPTREYVREGVVANPDYALIPFEVLRSRQELKEAVNLIYKMFIYEEFTKYYEDMEEFEKMNYVEMIAQLYRDKPTWANFMYVTAMMYVKCEEMQRLDKLKFLGYDTNWDL